ncbi:hypothetical protein VZT92_017157 [Zoarces viviparus]|uniref:Uncharacterized protein n=1 Tax=Zoarces viviparus TaxID=48416 RepID=A0AAW1ERD3_ZOAVI
MSTLPCFVPQVPKGVTQSIHDHDVEHRADIEGIWALGFNGPDPFPATEETEEAKEGDELVSVVELFLPRASCGNV